MEENVSRWPFVSHWPCGLRIDSNCGKNIPCDECEVNRLKKPLNQQSSSAVDHPDHYNQNGLEVIDIIAAFVPDWGVNGNHAVEFAHGNAVKYILRAGHKGKPIEDLNKAKWYIDYMIRELESQKN